ncbi:CHAT domain-containing protein [Streptomyces sp. NPDC057694]|uniref:CHAT domain-containing protein n=1 Tax=Streptomyces sp. NPDC057694 TaxID=3346216 RepID=UPI00368E5D86
MDLEEAVDTVRERVRRWERAGDPDAVTRSGALAAAGRIWQTVLSGQGTTVEAVHALAALHWARTVALGQDGPVDDLWGALKLYGAVRDAESVTVPDEVRTLLTGNPLLYDLSEIGPEPWGRRATRLLQDVQIDEGDGAEAVEKLDEVIELLGGTVEAYPPDHEYRVGDLSNLSLALHMRYFRRGDPADLGRAERTARAAVRATATWDPRLSIRLDNLSAALQYRARYTDDLSAWAEAVRLSERAVRRTSSDDQLRPMLEERLATARIGRYELTGDQDELDRAVEELERVVAGTPRTDRRLPGRMCRLGRAHHVRFFIGRDPRPLHRAVELLTKGADSTPPNSPDLAPCLVDLSRALLSRFHETGETRDLDDALAMAERAVQAGPGADAGPGGLARRAEYLHVFGQALFAASEHTHDRSFLDRAVDAFRAAVATRAADPRLPDSPGASAHIASLGEALVARSSGTPGEVTPFGLTDLAHDAARLQWQRMRESGTAPDPAVLADITEAYEYRLRAVERSAPHHPDLGGHLLGLSSLAYSLFHLHGRREDADRALELGERAVRVTPPRHPRRADALLLLAALLAELGGAAETERALALWQGLLTDPATAPSARASAAARAAREECRGGAWAAAVELYAQALDVLPSLVTPAQDTRAQEELLTRWSGLAGEAASCAIAAGDPDRAVELLEQGRGVLWSQLLDSRTELGALHDVRPDLAERLTSVERELNAPYEAGAAEQWWGRIADRRPTLAAEREDLVARIRAVPGFAGFRRPAGIGELRRAAADGPVVLVVSSQWRTDALIVSTTATLPVPLSVDHTELLIRTDRYLRALQQYEAGSRDALAQVTLNLIVTRTLGWLWRDIVEPPLRALELTAEPVGGAPRPRLWWCPTGHLALLPLHAAGLLGPDGRAAPAGACVQDRVTPSYTPTLRALLDSRADARPAAPGDRMLAVGLPTTPGHAPLPQVDDELAALSTAVPATTVLRGADATRQAVRDALRAHRWAHLSCHGGQDLTRPSQGGVVLHDAVLTVADLRSDRFAHGDFVFLSACQTALGGAGVPDEAVAVTSAFQYAGWRQIVGTLWSVGATTAAEVTAHLYATLARDGALDTTGAAQALYEAVRELRRAGHPPRVWAPFVHSGT